MATAILEFDKVEKSFTSRTLTMVALEGISLEIPEGSFTSIVGPSGCGKSTLLRLAAGLDWATRGETRYWGKSFNDVNTHVGFVTQDSNLFPWLTLRKNVEFGLRSRGFSAAQRRSRAEQYINMVGLDGFENHYPAQLSGGMQKRASIIRTMSYEPDTILMDEPFGPLDAQTRMFLQSDLLRIWAQSQQTIVFVTHDLTEAVALSDKVVVMSTRPGRIKSVFDIPLSRPRDIFNIGAQPGFQETYSAIWESFKSELSAE